MSVIQISLYRLLDIISWVIIIKSFLTWVPNETTMRLYNTLSIITEPIEAPIRKIMSKYMDGPLDFTPMIAIMVIMLLKNLVLLIP